MLSVQVGHLRNQCQEQTGTDMWDISAINAVNLAKAVKVTMPVNGVNLKMVIDSGSLVTAVGRDTLIPQLRLRPSKLQLTSFTGHKVPLIREGEVSVKFRGRCHRLRLVVVDMPGDRRLLGRDWMQALDISVGAEAAVMAVEPDGQAADLRSVCDRHASVFDGRPGRIKGAKRI